jgi:hypothetical protein
MTTLESCKELCAKKYGSKFNELLYDMALSRANLEMVFDRRYKNLEEFLGVQGCEKILCYYAQERDILLKNCGGDTELHEIL